MINLIANTMKWQESSGGTSYPRTFAVAINNLEKNLQENWRYPSHVRDVKRATLKKLKNL